MAQAFRLKTQPEILLGMLAQARAEFDEEIDLNVGSAWRTILEIASERDADQYIQISKLLKLFSIFKAKGVDLDQRMLDYGADIFPEMRRLSANTSIASITVGDTTTRVASQLIADVARNSVLMYLTTGTGSSFPLTGAAVLEQGTTREETIIFSRTSDNLGVLYPTTGVANAHPQGGTVTLIAIRTNTVGATLIGATSLSATTFSGDGFAASGSIVIDQGTVNEELVTFTRVGDVFTVPPLAFAHIEGTTIIQSTFGSDRTIDVGTVCYVPASETAAQVSFRVTTAGLLRDGAFESDLIPVESMAVGAETRVGANTISVWDTAPFTGATVRNPVAATRGRDREEDSDYLQRVLNFIQSMSRGTPLATTTLTSGVTDPVSGEQVAFAQIIEPVAPGLSYLYISNGSADFALTQTPFTGRDVIISDAEAGDRRGRLSSYGPFTYSAVDPVTPRLFKSYARGLATAVGANTMTDTLVTMTVNAHVGAYLKTDDNTFYEIVSNSATTFTLDAGGATPSLGTYSVHDFGQNAQLTGTSTAVGADSLTDGAAAMTVNAHINKWLTDSAGVPWKILSNSATVFTLDAGGATPAAGAYFVTAGYPLPLTPGTDFIFNQTNGDLELTAANALVAYDSLVAAADGANPFVGAYTYTTGLGAYVQRLVNGDPTDFTNFPGIRADGTQVLVLAPTTIATTFTIQVIAARGFTDTDLEASVQVAVETYVNSLGIGDNVIISEIIRQVKSLPGVADVKMIDPTSNVTVPAGSIMRISDVNVVAV